MGFSDEQAVSLSVVVQMNRCYGRVNLIAFANYAEVGKFKNSAGNDVVYDKFWRAS